METDKYKNYLYDLGVFIVEKAQKAKQDKDNPQESDDISYKIGYFMALHEVIDLMNQQAKAFNINRKDIGLADIDPESDLL